MSESRQGSFVSGVIRLLATGGLILLVARCGGSGDGHLGPTSYDLSGDWFYSEVLSDNSVGVTCVDSGAVVMTQSGSTFSATGTQDGWCSGPGGTQPFSGAFAITSGTISGRTIKFRIEPCPYTGTVFGEAPDSAAGTITCTLQVQGGTLHLTGTWRVRRGGGQDNVAPTVSGSASPPDTLVIGDTLTIHAQADDDRALVWVGWRLGAFPMVAADSVAVTGTHGTANFHPVTVAGWVGARTLWVFGRDAAGNNTEVPLGTITVGPPPSRPTRVFTMPGAVRDLTYDAKRNRLYVTQSSRPEIGVISLATSQVLAPIPLLSPGAGIDMSRGNDSVLVALGQSVYLAVADLVNASVDTVRLNLGDSSQRPDNLRVAANNTLLMSLTFSGSGFGGSLLTYDLAARTQQIRADVGINGRITERVPLARSGDGQKVMLLIDDSCCPEDAQVYSAATGSFGSRIGAYNRFGPTISGDNGATRWLMANQLFLADLTPLLTLNLPGYAFGPTVISPDASTAYLGTSSGYLKVRLSDQAVVETVTLGRTPNQLIALPGGTLLVAVSGTRVMVVDLQ